MHQSSYAHMLFFSIFIESFVIQIIDHSNLLSLIKFFDSSRILRCCAKKRSVSLPKQYHTNYYYRRLRKSSRGWLNFGRVRESRLRIFIFSHFSSIQSSRKQLEVFRHVPRVLAFALSSIFHVGCALNVLILIKNKKTIFPFFYEWNGKGLFLFNTFEIFKYSTVSKSVEFIELLINKLIKFIK